MPNLQIFFSSPLESYVTVSSIARTTAHISYNIIKVIEISLWSSLTPTFFNFLFADPHVPSQINRIISHPEQPVTITAHEDRHIRFFDNNTGEQTTMG